VAIVAAFATATCLALVPPAGADHPGSSERDLQALEAELLGMRHAAEHARQRRAAKAPSGGDAFLGSLRGGTLGQTGALSESEHLAAAAAPADANTSGAWSAPFELPLYAIHAAVLPTGKVLFFGPPGPRFSTNYSFAVLWDPATGTQELVNPPLAPDPMDGGRMRPANVYCSGQAFLADGQLLLAGGTLGRDSSDRALGLKKVYSFNPFDKTWTEQPDMEAGRWYPTQTLLPDGRQVIISGAKVFTADDNNTIELFNPAPNRNQRGTITKLAGVRGQSGQPPTSAGDLYPHLFAMPSGRTMVAGPSRADSWFLNTPGNGGPIPWSNLPDSSIRRTYGNSVLLPPAPGETTPSTKVMQIGGFPRGAADDSAVDSTETLDESVASPTWVKTDPALNLSRAHQNTVLLPDGSMVAVGGGTGENPNLFGTTAAHKQVELYDPISKTWRLGAAQAEPRAYHSVAVLLPDGRVVSAGDDGNPKSVSGALDTAEIYEPPYLFKGPRPTIASSPEAVRWGQTFPVATPDADIDRAVLIAPGATTHANNMHQRYVPLQVTRRTGRVELVAPATADVAPPGYYMLFLVNSAGVPSVAKFVRLDPNAPDIELPPDEEEPPRDEEQPPANEEPASERLSQQTHSDPALDTGADRVPPRVLGLALTSTRIRAAGRGATLRHVPARTRVRYWLSEPSIARFALDRAVGTRARSSKYVRTRLGFSRRALAGLNSFRLSGRLRGRRLRPGRYRLVLVAVDAAGNASSPARARFSVVGR
jgi:hypothetical protein